MTRSRGGTKERVVFISEISVPIVPTIRSEKFLKLWEPSAHQLRTDVLTILDELRARRVPAADLFVPNFWKAAVKLPEEHREPLLELWHLAHDIGREFFRMEPERFRVDRQNVQGMIYYCAP